ncbi:MAG: glutaminyl-peptide cyclotransferase, partial [Bacteroidota bacterium]
LKLKEYPHERSSFTQGLFFKEGQLYESTGENGSSKVMTVDLSTGKSIKSVSLPNELFGEGMTFIGDTLYHLTYKAGKAFMYDLNFKQLQTFYYQGEGWGLTHFADTLIMSNGSENITFRSKKDFSIYKTISVNDNNGPVKNLNELEIINGYLFANIYQTDKIVKIDLSNGAVVGTLDLSNIFTNRAAFSGSIDVLNGIAYKDDKVYVTGKNWPKLYEIKLID